MRNTIPLFLASALCLPLITSGQNLISNPGFETPWTAGPYNPCLNDIPLWGDAINWGTGYNRIKCERNDPGPAFQSFPNAENPNSWDSSPTNTGYVRWRSTNVTVVGHTNTLIKQLSTPLIAGATYTFRYRYTSYRNSGPTNCVLGARLNVGNSTACPGVDVNPVTSNTITVSNTSVPTSWLGFSTTFVAPINASVIRFSVRVSGFPAGQTFTVYFDDFQLAAMPTMGDEGHGDIDTDEEADVFAPSMDQLIAYPNPGQGTISVELPGNADVPGSLTVQDATGRVMMNNGSITGTRTTLDVGNLVPGMYLLTLQRGEDRYEQRFLRE